MQVINISRYAGSAGVYFSVESGKVTIWARVKISVGAEIGGAGADRDVLVQGPENHVIVPDSFLLCL